MELAAGPQGTSRAEIRLFGTPDTNVVLGVEPPPIVVGLLAFLVLYRGRRHHRSVICGVLWPDTTESKARRRLSSALWRLRRFLDDLMPGGSRSVITAGEFVAFDPGGPCWTDVTEFCTAVEPIRQGACIDATSVLTIERAVELYRGDLLEGRCEEWLVREREQLANDHLTLLECLADWHAAHGVQDRAIYYGRLILDKDPLREGVHRALIRIHIERGDRSAALRQLAQCRQLLDEHLGIPPSSDTIRAVAPVVGLSHGATSADEDVAHAIDELALARDHVKALHESLSRAIAALAPMSRVARESAVRRP